MTARVRLDQTAIELTAGGAVVAPVWVDFDGVTFPEEGWWDFAVPS